MNNSTTPKWFVDVTLFAVFLAAFFLDLTGLELHQWIGVAAGGLALYHLLSHGSWVVSVTERFFGKTAARARLYYLLDGSIFAGFAAIGLTGLAISSWLDLAWIDFDAWLSVHILAAIVTLLLTVAKIGLHWRWIVAAGKKIFRPAGARPQRQPLPMRPAVAVVPVAPARAPRQISRRDFINLMGIVGAASLIALSRAASGLGDAGEGEAGGEAVASAGDTGSTAGVVEVETDGGEIAVSESQAGDETVAGSQQSGEGAAASGSQTSTRSLPGTAPS